MYMCVCMWDLHKKKPKNTDNFTTFSLCCSFTFISLLLHWSTLLYLEFLFILFSIIIFLASMRVIRSYVRSSAKWIIRMRGQSNKRAWPRRSDQAMAVLTQPVIIQTNLRQLWHNKVIHTHTTRVHSAAHVLKCPQISAQQNRQNCGPLLESSFTSRPTRTPVAKRNEVGKLFLHLHAFECM